MVDLGRGSVVTLKGRHELEASIMTNDKRCGAVALITRGERLAGFHVCLDASPAFLYGLVLFECYSLSAKKDKE